MELDREFSNEAYTDDAEIIGEEMSVEDAKKLDDDGFIEEAFVIDESEMPEGTEY